MTSKTTDTLRFKLDQRDVDVAKPWSFADPFEDPIAQALKVLGHYRKVQVGFLYINAYKGNKIHSYQVLNTDEVRSFLSLWDRGQRPLPLIEVEIMFEMESTRKPLGHKRTPTYMADRQSKFYDA